MTNRGSRRREVWVGIFVLFGILATLAALFTFTEPSTFRGRYVISTVVEDAGGVRRGDSVELRGVSIGRVRGFELKDSGVLVRLEIERGYGVPVDSHVEIVPGGLIGGMVARIVPGESNETIRSGGILPGTRSQSLTESVERVAGESQRTFDRVQKLLSERTVTGVESSVAEMQALLEELNGFVSAQRSEIATLTRSLIRTAKSVEQTTSSPELSKAIRRLDPLTQKLDTAADSLDRSTRSMQIVLGRLERGEGTLGKLVSDDTLYRNATSTLSTLNATLIEVRILARDLREHPDRYVHLSVF